MADIQKFLDQSGVSTLWTLIGNKVTSAVNEETTRAKAAEKVNADAIAAETTRAKAAEAAASSAASKAQSTANSATNLVNTLIGEDTGMAARAIAAAEVAKIVAGANASYDTLKEIADWITTHGESASAMNTSITANKESIKALETLVGSTAVATQISTAINAALKTEGVDKYALAADLTTLSNKLTTLQGTGVRLITQDEITKLSKLVMDENGGVSMSGSIAAGNVQGLSAAIDSRIASQVVALTEAEIKSVCK